MGTHQWVSPHGICHKAMQSVTIKSFNCRRCMELNWLSTSFGVRYSLEHRKWDWLYLISPYCWDYLVQCSRIIMKWTNAQDTQYCRILDGFHSLRISTFHSGETIRQQKIHKIQFVQD